MHTPYAKILIVFIGAALCFSVFAQERVRATPATEAPEKEESATDATSAVSPKTKTDGPGAEMTERGHNLHGVYMPVGKVKTWAPGKMVRELKRIGADAVIMDFKDDFGRVTFTNKLELARGYPHGYLPRIKKHVKKLKENDIYIIARIVCFKDNWFATRWKEVAVLDAKNKGKWRDLHHQKWVDPHSQMMRDHIVSVAVAAEKLGVDEIQLDYVRFPVEPSARNARFPRKKAGEKRYEVIAELLRQVDNAISIPLSADVFGLTVYHVDVSERLGQYLEHLAPHLDAVSPMVYLANWPAQYYENPKPEKTYQVIKGACARIRERLGDDILVRPLLQAFQWRAENWGYGFIQNQINAAVDGGSNGHLFWNAGGRYGKVRAVWHDMKKKAENAEATEPESEE